jgi:hypothetical protein
LQELAAVYDIGQKIARLASVRQITSSLSRYIELFSRFLVALQNDDSFPFFRGFSRRSQTRRACAYNNYVLL